MKRLLATAVAAFALASPAAAQECTSTVNVCPDATYCSGTVSVCTTAQDGCDGFVSVCPMAHPDDCHSNVDVCLDFVGPRRR